MRVRWSRLALRDLDNAHDYVARNDPAAASRMIERIRKSVMRLEDRPAMGRVGRVKGTRELIVLRTPYIVPYVIRENEVVVLRIYHGARRWPTRF